MSTPLRIAAIAAALLAWPPGVVASPFLYVTNEGSDDVSVVDTARGLVVATVPVGRAPYGVAASPAGKRIYVASQLSDDVQAIDAATNARLATIPVGDTPVGIAVNPAGTRLYVANLFSNALSVIDTATSTITATVRVEGRPRGVAVSPDGARVYVTTTSPDQFVVVDAATNTQAASWPVSGQAYGVAVSQDATRVFFALHQVLAFAPPPPCSVPPCSAPPPLESGRVVIYDVAAGQIAGTVEVDLAPFAVAASSDGRRVYVSSPGAGSVAIVDPGTRTLVARASTGGSPHGVSLHPDGTRVYVADTATNSVVVLDAFTLERRASVPVGVAPVAFGAFVGPPPELMAVEYFHAAYGHYFMTADDDEIAQLDAGAISGWVRTGATFGVAPLGAPFTASVCRFWSGRTFVTKSSHFYTPDAGECAGVKANPDWIYEGDAFAITVPDANAACAAEQLPLYRLYNQGAGGAPNHRYTTSLAIRDDMLTQGWIPEGAGTLGVIGCVGTP